MLNPMEERQQLVVVALREGINFVIVTPGAIDSEPEKRLAGCGDDIIQAIVIGQERIGRLVVP